MRAILFATTLTMCAAGPTFGGDLNPPAGPIAPTPGPEPRIAVSATNTPGNATNLFRITQPGSYYLTGNVTGVAGKNGIDINASGVTLDLNGFELLGVAAMGAFDGVTISEYDGLGITITNGSIRGWGDCGIEVNYNGGHPASGVIVSDIHASANARVGIFLEGDGSVIRCTASENLDTGIQTSTSCTVTDCVARFNGGDGIATNYGCTITNCTSSSNTNDGIATGLGCAVSGCSASNNDIGFIGQGTTFSHCASYSNLADGFYLYIGGAITGCTAYNNGDDGIVGAASTISQCTTHVNTGDGIQVSSECNVFGNTCDNNGDGAGDGAGIHATGADNRIESNNCTDADRGIDVDAAGNIIIRNTCSGNANNWDVAAANVILVIEATTAAAVTGNSGGVSPGSTNPTANFTY